jgi:cytochrome c oxidase assembly protein subunit 15
VPVPSDVPVNATPRLARFAWATLGYNIAVVLWGAYVRASQSGAGCGAHWPFCNGEIVPRSPGFHMLVEFAHRGSSGLALILVVVLAVFVFRGTARGHLARWGAGLAVAFMFNEALLGALLVLLKKVAMDQSVGRAVYLCAHSTNTLLLLGSIALTAIWLARPEFASAQCYRGIATAEWTAAVLAAALTLLVAATGAIAALGDTLFPATSLHQAWAQDFAANAHYSLRLRALHPLAATALLLYLFWMRRRNRAAPPAARKMFRITLALLMLQFLLGIADILLLAPLWLQIVHLAGADLFWISLVMLLAQTLALRSAQPAHRTA